MSHPTKTKPELGRRDRVLHEAREIRRKHRAGNKDAGKLSAQVEADLEAEDLKEAAENASDFVGLSLLYNQRFAVVAGNFAFSNCNGNYSSVAEPTEGELVEIKKTVADLLPVLVGAVGPEYLSGMIEGYVEAGNLSEHEAPGLSYENGTHDGHTLAADLRAGELIEDWGAAISELVS